VPVFAVILVMLRLLSGDAWTEQFVIEEVSIPEGIDPQIGGISAMPSGKLAICFHRGEVMLFDPESGEWALFAEGLHEPLGVLAESDDSILVMQRAELTRLIDTDADGSADVYATVYDGFGMTGNYHEFAFGPARDRDGNLYVALNTASNGAGIRAEIRGPWSEVGVARSTMLNGGADWPRSRAAAGRMYARAAFRGWVVKLSSDGEVVTPFACGFRSPDGIGFDADGRLLVTDNQGDWLGTSKVHHVRAGCFHGHPASLIWRDGWDRDPLKVPVEELDDLRTPALALLPQGELASSPTQPIAVPPGVFGAFSGQTLIGEMNQKTLVRVLPDPVGGVSQGAAIPFLQTDALGAGNHRLAFTQDGSLWIGKTHLSWAGDEGLVRVRLRDAQSVLFAVSRVRATDGGFRIEFSAPVAPESALDMSVRAHTYNYFKAYGSPKVNDREVKIASSKLVANGRVLELVLSDMVEGHLYTISLRGLEAVGGDSLLGDKVYYTLLKKP
jgi:glucose/arabinose dehydrogenase